MTDDSYRPIKRIRQACQNCRRKKARCTGEKPECSFCVRLGQDCSYSDDESPPSGSSSWNGAPQAKRVQSRRFSNANGNLNGSAENAVMFSTTSLEELASKVASMEKQLTEVVQGVKGLESAMRIFLDQQARNSVNNNANNSLFNGVSAGTGRDGDTGPIMPAFAQLPSMDVIRMAVDLYFRYCHNQPYSLFHEGEFRNKIELNEVPTHLLFALLASTVRYSTDPFFVNKTAAVATYVRESWKAIVMPWDGIRNDGELSIVQTILLLAIIDYTDGRTQASWIKVGLAIRLAQDFRLMLEPDETLSPIQQEERRRVFWSFYLCDKLISCGRERPPSILDDHCKLQLPEDENEWRCGRHQTTPTLGQLTDDNSGADLNALSPFSSTVVLASLLGRCAQYALGEQEEQTPGGKLLPWNPRSKYSSIHSAVLHYESELGLNEPLSGKIAQTCLAADGSIDQHRAAPLAFAHALFYLCQCLLYHPFLLKQRLARIDARTPPSFLTQTFNSCRLAATSLSRLMGDVKSLRCKTLTTSYDPFYGYCNMVAGVIHSMFLHVSDPVVRDTASASFDWSMQNLKDLSYYWKSCGMMRARLEDSRANNDRYATLVDPAVQEVMLSADDANDLMECLDYARMSTTPRRRSQSTTMASAGGDLHALSVSQLPSPFFEELVNLLPLGNYNMTRPNTPPPVFDNIFTHSPQAAFGNGHMDISPGTATGFHFGGGGTGTGAMDASGPRVGGARLERHNSSAFLT